jgi:hypothetical protein
VSFVCVEITRADDYWLPAWRGQSGTTWAVWDNWIDYPDPMPADAVSINPAGLTPPYATADPASAFLMDSWTDSLGENRWNVLHITGDDELMFHLDNYDRNRPKKLIQIQITYDSDQAGPLAFNIQAGYASGVTPDHMPANLVAITEPPGWVTAAYEFSIEPNPVWEEIYLKFDWEATTPPASSAYVDQVVIDTWCVPEPVTLMLLAMGGVGAVVRSRTVRRRRRGA